MTRLAQILAGLEALTLVVVGVLETFFFRAAALHPIFLIEPDEHEAVDLWTTNVGVYNMLMGLAVIAGLVLVRRGRVDTGRTLVLTISAMHVVLGISLFITEPRLWLSAVGEFGLALAVVLAITLPGRSGKESPWARSRTA
ncbi:DUF1304 family protein [Tessaracoccus oleiagri]|uniref:DUF1304 domain-containing protein n=1 Tax=Tessaracoccus oleiagri TaxID=686624 RepID=A0A1G9JWG6_9ACTN|nr:DUF1304 family protein [Tessaracoccus oleiagri]SDL42000.1 Protein of unknown function [Tessaracoccus oleiagri]